MIIMCIHIKGEDENHVDYEKVYIYSKLSVITSRKLTQ